MLAHFVGFGVFALLSYAGYLNVSRAWRKRQWVMSQFATSGPFFRYWLFVNLGLMASCGLAALLAFVNWPLALFFGCLPVGLLVVLWTLKMIRYMAH